MLLVFPENVFILKKNDGGLATQGDAALSFWLLIYYNNNVAKTNPRLTSDKRKNSRLEFFPNFLRLRLRKLRLSHMLSEIKMGHACAFGTYSFANQDLLKNYLMGQLKTKVY